MRTGPRARGASLVILALLLTGFAVASAAPSGRRGSVRSGLQAAYAVMDKAVEQRETARFLSLCTPGFVMIGEDGEVTSRRDMEREAADPDPLPMVLHHILGPVAVSGREAVASASVRGTAIVPFPDSGPTPMPIDQQVRDTWIRTQAGWRLTRREVLGENGQPAVPDTRFPLQRAWRISDPALTGIAQASPADASLAILTREGEIRRLDMAGKLLGTLTQPGEQATSLAFSPDGARLMAGTQSGKAFVWDLREGTCRVVFEGAGAPVARVAWLPGTDRGVLTIYVPHEERESMPSGFVFDLAGGRTAATFRASSVTDYQTLTASPDGKQLGVLEVPDRARGAFLLNAATGAVERAFCHPAYRSGPLSIGIAPDGRTVAVGYAPYDVILWDAPRQRAIRALKGHSNWVVSLAFSADGRLLVSGAGDSTARLWNVATGKELGRMRLSHDCDYVKSVGFSHDGKSIFAATEDGQVIVVRAPRP